MAAKKEDLEIDIADATCRPIELTTENGFSIVRKDEGDGMTVSRDGQYRFATRDPRGAELDVTVIIAPEAVNEIIWRSHGLISSRSSYWVCCAERHLAEYLWERDQCPPNATLQIDLLTADDLNLARRWGTS